MAEDKRIPLRRKRRVSLGTRRRIQRALRRYYLRKGRARS